MVVTRAEVTFCSLVLSGRSEYLVWFSKVFGTQYSIPWSWQNGPTGSMVASGSADVPLEQMPAEWQDGRLVYKGRREGQSSSHLEGAANRANKGLFLKPQKQNSLTTQESRRM